MTPGEGGPAAPPHRERFRVPGVVEILVEQLAPDHFRVELDGSRTSSFTSLDAARAGAYNLARAEAHRLLAARREQAAEAMAIIDDLGSGDHFRLGLYRAAE